jgi:BirA family transcriptional regulator, biotin operon repressor / biotin---[acetyl-CoA-carboxylase] ligase
MHFTSKMPHDLASATGFIAASGSQLGKPLHVLAETESTNADAKEAIASKRAVHGETWVADVQSSGRGRQGRAWMAARGEALLFSTVVMHNVAVERAGSLSILVGIVVAEAIAEVLPNVNVQWKWPNDVWASSKKVAGILLESSTVGSRIEAIVVGVGINVWSREFPDLLAHSATSLALEGDESATIDRGLLLAAILTRLDRDLEPMWSRGLGLFLARLSKRDALKGKKVTRENGIAGVAQGVDEQGNLLVQVGSEKQRWSSGEVHLMPLHSAGSRA